MLERLGLWPLRMLWLVMPLTVGTGIVDAVSDRSQTVRTTIEIGMWIAWFVGLVATLAPSTTALTAVRILAPSALLGAVLAAATAGDQRTSSIVVAVGYGVIVTLLVMLPTTGDPMVNGSAYGSERRMALRPPAAVLMGPVELAWITVFVGAVTGPLLLAAGNLLIGVPTLVLGIGAIYAGSRSLHQLARRWIVFVPAGFVIHDYLSLAESILIQRRQKPTLGLATTDLGEHLDLSGGALGLALTVGFDEPVPVAFREHGEIESTTANRFVFTPSLPGQLLQEARARAINIS